MTGVTFLAFGNGSPDVFSTFAAMNTHSGSLALGELIGAAGFITAVVAGSMALVRPFKVARKSFVRDVGFFIVAASFSMVFLADGYLHLWECAVMVAFYIFYVITVVAWHWYLGQRSRRKEREILARSHFNTSRHAELEVENDDDEVDNAVGRRENRMGNDAEDFAALERGGSPSIAAIDEEADDETRDRYMAEISSNMRVSRPPRGERRNTATPIRPSLVGALEFRAVLSSLQKSRNIQTIPINLRRYSDDPTYTLAQQQENSSTVSVPEVGLSQLDARDITLDDSLRPNLGSDRSTAGNRIRAVSANDAVGLRLSSSALQPSPIPRFDLLGPIPPSTSSVNDGSSSPAKDSGVKDELREPVSPSLLVSPSFGESLDGSQDASIIVQRRNSDRLAPPQEAYSSFAKNHQKGSRLGGSEPGSPRSSPRSWNDLKLQKASIDSPRGPEASSPALQFPPYHDDPDYYSISSRPPSIRLPPSDIRSDSIYHQEDFGDLDRKPVRWWPYMLLPPPRVLASTLFPTLYSWGDKNIWEKLLGVIAAPSVFLLAITLPVVETEREDDDLDAGVPGMSSPTPGTNQPISRSGTASASLADRAIAETNENDIDYFSNPSRETRQHGNHIPSGSEVNGFGDYGIAVTVSTQNKRPTNQNRRSPSQIGTLTDPMPLASIDHTNQPPSSPKEWNRWLVSTQIFTGPIFIVVLVWANTDPSRSARKLLLSCIYAFILSLAVFAALLLTTTDSKPPRYRFVLCFFGFIVSIAWISTIANEVVGVLKAFGVILGISDATLGLTVFAVGNSLGDLVADVTVARLGYPVMALSACFGGPMLNILLGIGLSGLYMTIREGNGRHERHPNRPVQYKPYQIEVGRSLIISGVALLVTLVGLLIVVPLNKWVMDRKIGWGLVILWCVSTMGNLAVEIWGWGEGLA